MKVSIAHNVFTVIHFQVGVTKVDQSFFDVTKINQLMWTSKELQQNVNPSGKISLHRGFHFCFKFDICIFISI